MDDNIPSDAPRPRLCHLKKWSDFNGYGFNLHAERGKSGQYVGTIDDGSPALAANLRAGDRIIEVNGTNIGSENHQQVVQRIKAVPDETKVLVVDSETDAYYRELKIVIRGDMPNVNVCITPDSNPYTNPESVSEITSSVDNMKIAGPDYENYKARLCQLKIWPDFAGYGFNLHADQAKPGQFIGKVDEGSPAEAAGLQQDDRIVEVNGENVVGKSHADVVSEIKTYPNCVSLLVVDHEVDDYYTNAGIDVNSSMPGILIMSCPDVNPSYSPVNGDSGQHLEATASVHSVEDENHEEYKYKDDDSNDVPFETQHEDRLSGSDNWIESSDVGLVESEVVGQVECDESNEQFTSENYSFEQPSHVHEYETAEEPRVEVVSTAVVEEPVEAALPVDVTKTEPMQMTSSTPASKPVVVGGLEFAGSAKEARERMKKKANVKQNSGMSLKDKYEMLQRL